MGPKWVLLRTPKGVNSAYLGHLGVLTYSKQYVEVRCSGLWIWTLYDQMGPHLMTSFEDPKWPNIAYNRHQRGLKMGPKMDPKGVKMGHLGGVQKGSYMVI